MSKIIKVLLILCAFAGTARAQQNEILDEIIAKVGESIILKSDLEKSYQQLKDQYTDYEGDLRCELFHQLLTQKLLLYKAELDSIVVPDERVEYEIERRINYFAQQAGGERELEKYLQMSLVEYKAEMRKKMKEEMLIDEARNTLLKDVKVTPTDVRKFYEDIPKDSLPEFGAEVEVAQLVMIPKASEFAENYAKKTAERIRSELLLGKTDFCIAAAIYSKDDGSKNDCGNLGDFKRGQMVPEFEAAVFKLKKDSISPVIKTAYGYHIIQLIERRGDIANARHILIRPEILTADNAKVTDNLRQIRSDIEAGKISWCDAVIKYSEDEQTKGNCGFFTDPNVGSSLIGLEFLETEIARNISTMKAGQISTPLVVPQYDGTNLYRIVYLKTENPPHIANIEQDYQKISLYAEEKKKQDALESWVKEFRKEMYIWIDEKYFVCPETKSWVNKSQQN
ncbi:MAG: peptidylprolyl isomerase [Flavobacteriales bacterium]|nr:peptidylprolyl isomerase [Flavobacteriales bacterium]